MTETLAYHLVVNAMEARAGWTPSTRLASAVTSVINGHLPHHRLFTAGRDRKKEGVTEGRIESMINDWIPTDLNAVFVLGRSMKDPLRAIRAYNAYYALVNVGVRTNVATALPDAHGSPKMVATRNLLENTEDPAPCKICSLAVLNANILEINRNNAKGGTRMPATLSSVARLLGREHSAAGEVALVFESVGPISIGLLAQSLGCHQRTLERRLRQEGLTAESLRQAVRLIRATNRLQSSDSLTMIALDEGFSDLAHMTRAFQTSTGMPPSLLRRLTAEDVTSQ